MPAGVHGLEQTPYQVTALCAEKLGFRQLQTVTSEKTLLFLCQKSAGGVTACQSMQPKYSCAKRPPKFHSNCIDVDVAASLLYSSEKQHLASSKMIAVCNGQDNFVSVW